MSGKGCHIDVVEMLMHACTYIWGRGLNIIKMSIMIIIFEKNANKRNHGYEWLTKPWIGNIEYAWFSFQTKALAVIFILFFSSPKFTNMKNKQLNRVFGRSFSSGTQ